MPDTDTTFLFEDLAVTFLLAPLSALTLKPTLFVSYWTIDILDFFTDRDFTVFYLAYEESETPSGVT